MTAAPEYRVRGGGFGYGMIAETHPGEIVILVPGAPNNQKLIEQRRLIPLEAGARIVACDFCTVRRFLADSLPIHVSRSHTARAAMKAMRKAAAAESAATAKGTAT